MVRCHHYRFCTQARQKDATLPTLFLRVLVIVPYVSGVWERMELRPDHPAVVLYDTFKGHKGEKVEELLKENYLLPVPIPSNCTDRLQPVAAC